MDTNKLLATLIEAASFISAFAGIAAGFVMANVRKKFGTGLLATGFKSISIGVFFIAGGITIDAIQTYITISNSFTLNAIIIALKEALFVIGTYVIVIGSKKTGDKLESLTK